MIVTYPSGPGGKANAPDAIAAFIAAFRAITLARSSGLRPSGSSVSGILERKRSRASLSRPSGGAASSGGTRLFVIRIGTTSGMVNSVGYGAASRAKKIAGAGNGIRTRDPDLGKVVLYHCAIPANHRAG